MSATLRTEVQPIDPHRLGPLLGPAPRLQALLQTAADVRNQLGDRHLLQYAELLTGLLRAR